MNTVIIVAAGSGERFGAATSKQFVRILGKPVIIHTLERFEACSAIDEIVLVLSEEGRREFVRTSGRSNISKIKSIVTGGKNRAESVRNGLNAIDGGKAEIVAVHDGARPLVLTNEINRTVEKAIETGAACLVTDLTDTIKAIDGDHIVNTIDRNRLRRALTPQAFRYDILRRAFDGVELTDSITDECYLVEKLGIMIALVEGNAWNIKITRPHDLVLAAAFLSEPTA